MRRALLVLSLVAAIAGEAPYHLPQPSGPAFNYPSAPAPFAQPQPQPQVLPAFPAPAPQFPPQQAFIPNSGYNYQTPNIAPTFVQQAPQYPIQAHPHPHPPPPPHHHHHHSHPPPHHHHPGPQPQHNSYPQSQSYSYPAPAPAFNSGSLQLSTAQFPAPAPQPQPLPLLQAQPQPQPFSLPSTSYGIPQAFARAPVAPAPQPIQTLPAFIAPQPAPQPAPLPAPQPQAFQSIAHYQQQQQQQQQQLFSAQQGYNYQQPIAQAQQPQVVLPQFAPQPAPLPAQIAAAPLSSYQADSHQYNTAQDTHGEGLDSLVVNHVQNIIKENEHTVARNAGYQSLISGVSLEQAKPSVEISSFTQSSPLVASGSTSQFEGSSSAQSSALSVSSCSSCSSPSQDYGLPVESPKPQASGSASSSFNFLPQNKPAVAYGPPK